MYKAVCFAAAITCAAPLDVPHSVSAPDVGKPAIPSATLPKPEASKPKLKSPRPAFDCNVPGTDKYDRYFVAAGMRYNVDACHLKAQAYAESLLNPKAVSHVGAKGIAQFMPGTAKQFNLDPFDPKASIFAQAKYMKYLKGQWRRHGRTEEEMYRLAWACYNWGLGNVLKLQSKWGGVLWEEMEKRAPRETRGYVKRIERLMA